MKKKRPAIAINGYNVFQRALEEGANYGWNRAHKHNDNPGKEEIVDAMILAINSAVCEYFTFSSEFDE